MSVRRGRVLQREKKKPTKKQNPDTHSNADVPDTHAQMRKLNSAARE